MNQTVPIYNMSYILEELGKLITSKFVTELNYIKRVHILTSNEAMTNLTVENIPAIIITPIGEVHTVGPAANMARQIYSISIKIVARSSDPNKFRTKLADKNIFDLTQKLRELLYKNKRLDNKLFEMKNNFIVRDIDVLFNMSDGVFNAREINIEYVSIEAYVLESNSQPVLQLPHGIIFT